MRNFLNGTAFPADVDVHESQSKTKLVNGQSNLLTPDAPQPSNARARSHSSLSVGDTNSVISSGLRRASNQKRVSGSGTTVDSSQSSLRGQNLIQSVKKSLAKTKRQWDRSGFIHVIYVLVLLAYSFLGGAIFMALDGPHADRMLLRHQTRCVDSRESLWGRLIDECSNRSFSYCENRTRALVDRLDHCLRSAPQLPFNHSTSDYWNSLIYAITVFTTIGYGNVVVLSTGGRVAMILYAMIGIPLFFAFLNDMGQWFHFKFLKLYDWLRRKWLNSVLYKTLLEFVRRRYLKPRSMATGNAESRKLKVVKGKDEAGEKDGHDSVLFLFAVGVLIFYLVLVCGLFMIMVRGQWDFLQAFYFMFQSISLIGFGDEFPEDPNVVLINIIFIIIGIILLSMCFFILQEWIRGKTYRLSTHVRRSVRRWRHYRPVAHSLFDRRRVKAARISVPMPHLGGANSFDRRWRRRTNSRNDENVAGQRLAVVHDCSPGPGRRAVVAVLTYEEEQGADDGPPVVKRRVLNSPERRVGVHSVDETTLFSGKLKDGPLEAEDLFSILRSSTGCREHRRLADARRHTVMCLDDATFVERERRLSWLLPKEEDEEDEESEPKRKPKVKQTAQKRYSVFDRPRFGKFQWIGDDEEEEEIPEEIEEKEEAVEEDAASDSENNVGSLSDDPKNDVSLVYEKEEFL